MGFDYVIRFRGHIQVTDAHGQTRAAAQWVGHGGRARTLRGAAVTADRSRIGTVVCVPAKGMKEPGCLATHSPTATARILINYYAKRWGLETGFRDTQDLRFGMGLGWVPAVKPWAMTGTCRPPRSRLALTRCFAKAVGFLNSLRRCPLPA